MKRDAFDWLAIAIVTPVILWFLAIPLAQIAIAIAALLGV